MKEEVKMYHCGFKITAQIKAWLWRRENRRTTIGKIMDADCEGLTHVGYFIVGVLRDEYNH